MPIVWMWSGLIIGSRMLMLMLMAVRLVMMLDEQWRRWTRISKMVDPMRT
ncbi:MAG: hypothetical protein ETSY2_34960 [Candidatus Entotheonella gemina]|uniref:Uncharacterized protein n=1 Tax=Candidatus Entotheonella gemina TaxID=1429439 RepID=W4LY85_9BACT|nr:MAG: hypothetical protein ETSY2_34960 [Candidatus Entotheonella gemina]